MPHRNRSTHSIGSNTMQRPRRHLLLAAILAPTCPNITPKCKKNAQLEAQIGQHSAQDASRVPARPPQHSKKTEKICFFLFFAFPLFRKDVLQMLPKFAKKLPIYRQFPSLWCFLARPGRKMLPSRRSLGLSWRLLGPSWTHLGKKDQEICFLGTLLGSQNGS